MAERWSPSTTARIAGLLYLVTVVTGIIGLIYVPSQISVPHNLPATIANIVASRSLYRCGIAAGLVCYTAFLVVPLLLYRLLNPIDRAAAVLMVLFAAVNVSIALSSIADKLDILSLLDRPDRVPTIASDVIQTQVMRSLDAYNSAMLIGEIFAGLWLIPFGCLVIKSGFLPKILGILLIAGGFGYLLTVFGHVLMPDYERLWIAGVDTLPAGIGEIGISLWLLAFGVNVRDRQTKRNGER